MWIPPVDLPRVVFGRTFLLYGPLTFTGLFIASCRRALTGVGPLFHFLRSAPSSCLRLFSSIAHFFPFPSYFVAVPSNLLTHILYVFLASPFLPPHPLALRINLVLLFLRLFRGQSPILNTGNRLFPFDLLRSY